MLRTSIQIFVLLSFIIVSCNPSRDLDVDVSDVDVKQVDIRRYEKAIFSISREKALRDTLKELHKRFPFFVDAHTDSAELVALKGYLNDPVNKDLYDAVSEKYSSLTGLENQLTKMFKHYKYYFPDFQPPVVYSYISSLNHEMPIIYHDSTLVISLDMYLGEETEFYGMIGLPKYMTRWFQKAAIVPDVVEQMVKSKISEKPDPHLLDHMVQRGKLLYVKEALMPDTDFKYKIKYTGSQLEWARQNEVFVWGLLLEKNLLFSKDRQKIQNFIDDAPFTSSISRESPPRLADWLGWKIVKNYMDENQDVSMKELLHEKNSRKILKKSKYKPARKQNQKES